MRASWCGFDGRLLVVNNDELISLVASLVRERNAIDAKLAQIMHRPMASGHLGEWLASQIFDIELEKSAVTRGWDGRFRSGPLHDRTVNIKWYSNVRALSTRSSPQRWTATWYWPARHPRRSLHEAAPAPGTSTPCTCSAHLNSTPSSSPAVSSSASPPACAHKQWTNAEIYPSTNPLLPMTPRQVELLGQFRSE
jgi:hypothetical protein